MSNQPEHKDFLTWWKEDFGPGLVATRKALEPHIKQWQQIAVALNKALSKFIEEHRESIELWVQFAEIYPQLEPYINNITYGLNDPDFEIANDVVELAHIFETIDLQQDPSAISLLDVISGEAFQSSLINFYSNLTLDENRLPLIKEALELHNSGHYAGSICLLYGQIEGVLTESFEKANYIIINQRKTNPVKEDGSVNNKSNLTGLVPKLEHAITRQDQLQSYYSKIKTYELVAGDSEETIPKTRNKILHGSEVMFNTEKRSAQLILWLYSTILQVRVLGI
ncbi:hypothetical protein CWB60_02060 [Pseudoalteromonas sp. S327]|uniref:hypothetical protein n=1 Tax=Pseudoalteromonas TaxID=53246 RepID=UPI00110A3508|nr:MULTISPECIES: hypothetical protein [unclassified Pseudoalteromonas]TMO10135.1 hypothetical protein CWB60_02060 [Pseudoalteromonas sp. S327]TMO20161.1 hypothetical protein CWB59_01675 [Pseudoalteromonas sp. S326]